MTKYIRFDWAIKKLLRQKANFVVLEGFLSTLLEKTIKIDHLLESESNQESEEDKQNRVDILAEDDRGEKYIIEVQNANETAYFQRVLFGTSKLITEYMSRGDQYDKVPKVYSINIVYFDLGRGKDYIYHGTTEFRGIHHNDLLNLSPFQMERFGCETVHGLFPEYYVLKVNGFDDVAKTPLEEWIKFLKDQEIPESPTAPGLREAREIMNYDAMSKSERDTYNRHIDNLLSLSGSFELAVGDARIIGRAEGRMEERFNNAKALLSNGVPADIIATSLGLSTEEVESLKASL
mgnify:CR=1 FL=1